MGRLRTRQHGLDPNQTWLRKGHTPPSLLPRCAPGAGCQYKYVLSDRRCSRGPFAQGRMLLVAAVAPYALLFGSRALARKLLMHDTTTPHALTHVPAGCGGCRSASTCMVVPCVLMHMALRQKSRVLHSSPRACTQRSSSAAAHCWSPVAAAAAACETQGGLPWCDASMPPTGLWPCGCLTSDGRGGFDLAHVHVFPTSPLGCCQCFLWPRLSCFVEAASCGQPCWALG